MITLSENTLKGYAAGKRKAATVLAAYLPKSKSIDEIINGSLETETERKYFTEPENIQFYRWTEVNKMVTHRLIEPAKKTKKTWIQTGQANKWNGIPYARIYTDTKTGRNYVIYTGF